MAPWSPFDASNIHAFRLKVKELRYTFSWIQIPIRP